MEEDVLVKNALDRIKTLNMVCDYLFKSHEEGERDLTESRKAAVSWFYAGYDFLFGIRKRNKVCFCLLNVNLLGSASPYKFLNYAFKGEALDDALGLWFNTVVTDWANDNLGTTLCLQADDWRIAMPQHLIDEMNDQIIAIPD